MSQTESVSPLPPATGIVPGAQFTVFQDTVDHADWNSELLILQLHAFRFRERMAQCLVHCHGHLLHAVFWDDLSSVRLCRLIFSSDNDNFSHLDETIHLSVSVSMSSFSHVRFLVQHWKVNSHS